MSQIQLSRRSVLAGAGVAIVAMAGAAALIAPASGSAPVVADPALPASIVAAAPELYPEGFTYDPTRGAFLVGSARWGNVSVVTGEGKITELVPPLGPVSTLGIQLDLPRNQGVVAYSDFWIRQKLPAVGPPMSALARFDLTTGAVLQRIDLDPGNTGPTFANDLTLDADGNAYVTNSVSQTIVRVTPDGTLTKWYTDARFAAKIVGANGITYHPDGFLLVARYDTGVLYRIPVDAPEQMTEVALPKPIIGVDGMRLNRRRELVVVTNSIGEAVGVPGGVDAVTVYGSTDGWKTATVTRQTNPWPLAGPTTVAFTPSGDYILSGNVGVLLSGGTSNELTISRF